MAIRTCDGLLTNPPESETVSLHDNCFSRPQEVGFPKAVPF